MRPFFRLIGAIALFCISLTPLNAIAEDPQSLDTAIVFTNSSLDDCSVNMEGTAVHTSPLENISPLATEILTRIRRTPGDSTTLDIIITNDDGGLTVQLETASDQLFWDADAIDLALTLNQKSDIHTYPVLLGDAEYTIGFKGTDLHKGGTLEVVLQKKDIKPVMGAANDFNVLSYNIWATTIYGSKKVNTRLGLMPDIMAGYDALVLTEVFDLISSSRLMGALRKEYPYQSGEIFKAGKLMKSGTRILSRWPFVEENSHIYDGCNGIQCAATRGVIHARINKMGQIYNIFGTHTQSSDDRANRDARLAQIEEMGDFVRSLNLPSNEPVIFAGDFNINKIGLPQDFTTTTDILDAAEPENLGHNLSYDSETNGWASPPFTEYLDYTLYSENHPIPSSATQEIFAPRSIMEKLWGKWDISDHYACRGTFSFDLNPAPYRPGFPYYGDIVHFKTANGHYLRAMSGGGSFLSAGSNQPGTWESFTIEDIGRGKVAIKDRNGNYVRVNSWLFGTLRADRSSIGRHEKFRVRYMGGGKIALKAYNGRYLRADFGGGAGLSAGSWWAGRHQTFQLIRN